MAGDAVACGPSSSMDEGVVYVGCNSGMLFAVNATTGTQHGMTVQYGMHPSERGQGCIHVRPHDSWIGPLLLAGEEQWRFKTGGPIFGTPAVAKVRAHFWLYTLCCCFQSSRSFPVQINEVTASACVIVSDVAGRLGGDGGQLGQTRLQCEDRPAQGRVGRGPGKW